MAERAVLSESPNPFQLILMADITNRLYHSFPLTLNPVSEHFAILWFLEVITN